ncbi:MAG TPA: dihydrofolate reductase family protein [Chitinophagaceae bacterium]|jgi:dihydrofolate reductase|nr:dihydrofolate reductase family protein [Chitinophagaceae bacterium]
MKKLIVFEWITLDGIFDADTMNDWFIPYHSDARANYIQQMINNSDSLLYGRETYQMLYPYWSSLKNNEMGVAEKLNNAPKYVVSSSLKKAEWKNSTIIKGNIIDEIKKLKQQQGSYILLQGSAHLADLLAANDMVDEFHFLVQPHVAGEGKRFFKKGMQRELHLQSSESLDKGVLKLVYRAS